MLATVSKANTRIILAFIFSTLLVVWYIVSFDQFNLAEATFHEAITSFLNEANDPHERQGQHFKCGWLVERLTRVTKWRLFIDFRAIVRTYRSYSYSMEIVPQRNWRYFVFIG